MSKQYAERDIESLDELGGFYSLHVSAMTAEDLHGKSAIAAELGHRDMVISELLEALQDMVALVKSRAYPQPDKPSSDWGRAEVAEDIIRKALGE